MNARVSGATTEGKDKEQKDYATAVVALYTRVGLMSFGNNWPPAAQELAA